MEIKEYKCPNCGSSLEIYMAYKRAFCKYCNSNFVISNILPTDPALPNTISFETDVVNHMNIISYDEQTIKSALSIISGVSCIQGNKFDVSIGYTDGKYDICNREEKENFSNDYSIKDDLKKLKRYFYRFDRDDFESSVRNNCSSLNERGNSHILKIRELFNHYGCSINDGVEETIVCRDYSAYTKPDKHANHYQIAVTFSGKFHRLIGNVCVTPSFFCNYFRDIDTIYKSIQTKEELVLLAKRFSEHLIDFFGKNPDHRYFVLRIDLFSVLLKERFGESARTIDRICFHDIGMENISDRKIMIALAILLITQMNKNGLNIGLSDFVECDTWDGAKCFSEYGLTIQLVNMQKPVYKSFI